MTAFDPAEQPAPLQNTVFHDHPLRRQLTNEVHARPPEALAAPMRVTMLAMLSGENHGGAAAAAGGHPLRRLFRQL